MLPPDAGHDAVEAQAPSPQIVPEKLSDTALAHALVHAIRAMPGVVDMGQGVFAKAATYGPGEHVVGIVLHHPTPGALAVEVHVVLEEASITVAFAEASHATTSSSSSTTPLLLRVTDQIRDVVTHTLAQLGVQASTPVDVTVDDIR
jgi:hypothetical protein